MSEDDLVRGDGTRESLKVDIYETLALHTELSIETVTKALDEVRINLLISAAMVEAMEKLDEDENA